MQLSTLEKLQCPIPDCGGALDLSEGDAYEGVLKCKECKAGYPILAGVAVVVPDPEGYVVVHAKGIMKWVKDEQIPKSIRKSYLLAKKAIEREHIEEDLESERVNALYFMTHFLNAAEAKVGVESPEIEELISKYWDAGPFSVVKKWIAEEAQTRGLQKIVEVGCGIGGVARLIADQASEYLGIDSSFASIALARSIYFKEGNATEEQGIPADLLQGPLSRKLRLGELRTQLNVPRKIDFIVGDFEAPPLKESQFDGSIVLNAIDMMGDPSSLPRNQKRWVRNGGFVIQSAPYIWHEQVATHLRKTLKEPPAKNLTLMTSAQAVESLYIDAGLSIEKSRPHIPWIFFKHLRQVELYSVHAFFSRA